MPSVCCQKRFGPKSAAPTARRFRAISWLDKETRSAARAAAFLKSPRCFVLLMRNGHNSHSTRRNAFLIGNVKWGLILDTSAHFGRDDGDWLAEWAILSKDMTRVPPTAKYPMCTNIASSPEVCMLAFRSFSSYLVSLPLLKAYYNELTTYLIVMVVGKVGVRKDTVYLFTKYQICERLDVSISVWYQKTVVHCAVPKAF